MTDQTRYLLNEKDIPTTWYNIQADLPEPMPPVLNPVTQQPIGPEDLAPLFPMGLIEQEVSTQREIDIPGEVIDIYRLWRPTPLHRARRLEKALDTPARIYYNYEGGSPSGSHKTNTSVAQAYYNKAEGVKRITTETGAGQWGSALAMACNFFGIDCKVFMVRVSFDQKPYRKAMMEMFGAEVFPSPSTETVSGRAILEKDPNTTGSLGIAISEAVELAAQDPECRYALGSVLNHVLMHQTVIGQEMIEQFKLADDWPDIVIGCAGGGSNLAGFAFPLIGRRLRGEEMNTRFIAVEPAACPTMTKGPHVYDFGDVAHMTPLVKMHTLGSGFVPPGIHAGGLRYHGMGPLISHLIKLGEIEPVAVHQLEIFEAATRFARSEGIVPAPEPAHALALTLREALRCKEEGQSRAIVCNLCGHGHFDMQAYLDYFAGKLHDYEYPEEEIAMALAGLPSVGSG
jgi:tryptophan synthase beta chain